jgi:hypothetical protein
MEFQERERLLLLRKYEETVMLLTQKIELLTSELEENSRHMSLEKRYLATEAELTMAR